MTLQAMEQAMSARQDAPRGLAAAIAARRQELGMSEAQLVARMTELSGSDRTGHYRLLRGETRAPRLDKFLCLCRALRLSPTALLIRAGLWSLDDFSYSPKNAKEEGVG